MKKWILSLSVLLLLAMALPSLVGCGGGGGAVARVKDEFGFKRPKNSWITECLLLPREPVDDKQIEALGDRYTNAPDDYIKYEELWGESGENGLASEMAAALDGQCDESGNCWLVYLIYANEGIPNSAIGENATASWSINYLDGNTKDSVDHAGIANSFGDVYAGSNGSEYYVWCLEDAASVSQSDLGKATAVEGALQGAIVFPLAIGGYEGPKNGTLYAEVSVRGLGAGTEKIDNRDAYRFSEAPIETTAEISSFSVRYLPFDAYNNGNYTDTALTNTASFADGKGCYAVLDITMTALQDNDGGHTVEVLSNASNAMGVSMTIEEAPTGRIQQSIVGSPGLSNYHVILYTSYTLPAKAGESKTVRMVVRILPVGGGKHALNFFAIGDARTAVSGLSHVEKAIDAGEAIFSYKLNAEKDGYLITKLLNTKATTAVIPDTLGDGLPVVGFEKDVFKETNSIQHIFLGKNITVMIPYRAFAGCWNVHTGKGLLSLTFDGTMEQWRQVKKELSWNFGSGLEQVSCSDGVIDLKQ